MPGGWRPALAILAMLSACAAPAIAAETRVGVVATFSGRPGAQGVGDPRAFEVLPDYFGGELAFSIGPDGVRANKELIYYEMLAGDGPITWLVRDDGGDPATAVALVKQLIGDDRIDVLIGPSQSPAAQAVLPLVNAAHVPMIAMAPIVFDADQYRYGFSDAHPIAMMIDTLVHQMQARGVYTLGFLGASDRWSDDVFAALKAAAGQRWVAPMLHKTGHIDIVADERHAATDPAVQESASRVIARQPDAVMLGGAGAAGAPANVALTTLGYRGKVYSNQSAVTAEYLRIGGDAVAGCIAPASPLPVYQQLADADHVKQVIEHYITSYYYRKFEGRTPDLFAGLSYDAFLLIANAMPAARKQAQPGTPEFRDALRAAIEKTRDLVGTNGIYRMTPSDHNGMDREHSVVLVQAEGGAWRKL